GDHNKDDCQKSKPSRRQIFDRIGCNRMKQISVIIFDLDGVLVDATEWHYEALNRALAHFGYTIPRYDHLTSYNGLPTQKKLEMLSVEKGLPRALHSFVWKLKQKDTTEEVSVNGAPAFCTD